MALPSDDPLSIPPLAFSVAEASRASTLGKTRLYQLIAAGRLATTKIGKRRLIHADSLHRLIKEGL